MPAVLKSMELSEDAKSDAAQPYPMPSKPDYPYGLHICLTGEELEKLGLDPGDAEVGGTFQFTAMARITDVAMNDSERGYSCRIEAQIENMAVDTADE